MAFTRTREEAGVGAERVGERKHGIRLGCRQREGA